MIKLVSSILIWASLALGAIAATTGYLPTLDVVAAADPPLTLAAGAGATEVPAPPAEEGEEAESGVAPEMITVPLVPATDDDGTPTVLTADVIARLRAGGVERVRVKEFAVARWEGRWLFLLACAGLLVGALLVRHDARRAAAGREMAPGVEESPEDALHRAHDEVQALRTAIAGLPEAEQIRRIVETLDEVQATHIAAFVDARAPLIARLGMSGYARLMDRFAAAERQLNRAWSAAADHVIDEALHCLDKGAELLEEATARLPGQKG